MAEKDAQALVEIKQRIDRLTSLTQTRGQAKGAALLKFKPQHRIGNRDEHIAEFLSQTTGMVPYSGRWLQRYGGLINKTDRPRQPPRHGTFAPKVAQTKVIGARRVVKDLKALMDTLGRFILNHAKDKTAMRGVQKQLGDAARSIQTRTSYKG